MKQFEASDALLRQQDMHTSRFREVIDEHGFVLMTIFPCEGKNELPFFYTIGLSEQNLPELMISGRLDPKIANTLIRDQIEQWKKDGVRIGVQENLITDKSGAGLRAMLNEVDVKHLSVRDEFAVQLFQHYEHFYPDLIDASTIRLVQIVWPDTENRLPQESGYNMPDAQEVLPNIKLH